MERYKKVFTKQLFDATLDTGLICKTTAKLIRPKWVFIFLYMNRLIG